MSQRSQFSRIVFVINVVIVNVFIFDIVFLLFRSCLLSIWTKVSKIALKMCWLNVIVFVIVFLLVRCFVITLIKCLKGHTSLGSLCVFQNQKWLTRWQGRLLSCPETLPGEFKISLDYVQSKYFWPMNKWWQLCGHMELMQSANIQNTIYFTCRSFHFSNMYISSQFCTTAVT